MFRLQCNVCFALEQGGFETNRPNKQRTVTIKQCRVSVQDMKYNKNMWMPCCQMVQNDSLMSTNWTEY